MRAAILTAPGQFTVAQVPRPEPGAIGPMNIGNPGEFTIRELAEMVIRLTGSSSKLTFSPLPADDPMQRQPDIRMARELLGWEPRVQLEEGLTKTIAYFDTLLGGTRRPASAMSTSLGSLTRVSA